LNRYTSNNCFKHTFCDFKKVDHRFFNENQIQFKSKSGSSYFYTDEGVYRYSNHWGRVANCRWRLLSDKKLKSQEYHVGFAKWSDFYSLKETEKQFYISVNFETKEVGFHHQKESEKEFLFFAETAQKRVAQIRKLLTEDTWARYFEMDIEALRFAIISEYLNSNKLLQEIKAKYN
jgi:hypothetical protein